MYIGRTKGFGTNWRKMNAGATKILKELDIPAEATQQLSSYSIAIQQMVAIARAVDMDCKVLILDEPTSSLDDSEVEKLFKMMRDLESEGRWYHFVTHFLEQVYAVCDKITVLRDGQLVGQYEIRKSSENSACCQDAWKRGWMMKKKSKTKVLYTREQMQTRMYLWLKVFRATLELNRLISISRKAKLTDLPDCSLRTKRMRTCYFRRGQSNCRKSKSKRKRCKNFQTDRCDETWYCISF